MSCTCRCVSNCFELFRIVSNSNSRGGHALQEEAEEAELEVKVDAAVAGAATGYTAMQNLRIVTLGISRGESLTWPLHNARRCVSTQLKPVLAFTRKPRKFGIFPLFKDYSLLDRPKPYLTIRNYFHRCRRRERPGRGPRRRAVGWAAGELLQWLGERLRRRWGGGGGGGGAAAATSGADQGRVGQ
jgi:hypothetical protein